ncbi:MarR family winged helix-turn-helix transcriptional regulator [Egibacter rhizosphaerae]|uniref:MarR family winged helix-turn-helix transcriptional regulator n=1 Tax=Egibacter rhizosphaerae TaxID=1670831 RepID=UPI00197AED3E|nr:MarR family transcriptional regulator [Egibacter rhizosphaerae]
MTDTEQSPRKPAAPGTPPTELQRLALQEAAHPDVRPLEVQAIIWLFRAYNAVQAEFGESLRPQGLSASAFNLLQALVNTPGSELEPCDLAERLLVSRPSVTGLIDTLEAKGMVTRQPHPEDRRRVLVALTAAGRELLESHYPHHYAMLEGVFGHLHDDELAELVVLLRRVRGAIPSHLLEEQGLTEAVADER